MVLHRRAACSFVLRSSWEATNDHPALFAATIVMVARAFGGKARLAPPAEAERGSSLGSDEPATFTSLRQPADAHAVRTASSPPHPSAVGEPLAAPAATRYRPAAGLPPLASAPRGRRLQSSTRGAAHRASGTSCSCHANSPSSAVSKPVPAGHAEDPRSRRSTRATASPATAAASKTIASIVLMPRPGGAQGRRRSRLRALLLSRRSGPRHKSGGGPPTPRRCVTPSPYRLGEVPLAEADEDEKPARLRRVSSARRLALRPAEALVDMVVHQPHRLHERIDRRQAPRTKTRACCRSLLSAFDASVCAGMLPETIGPFTGSGSNLPDIGVPSEPNSR